MFKKTTKTPQSSSPTELIKEFNKIGDELIDLDSDVETLAPRLSDHLMKLDKIRYSMPEAIIESYTAELAVLFQELERQIRKAERLLTGKSAALFHPLLDDIQKLHEVEYSIQQLNLRLKKLPYKESKQDEKAIKQISKMSNMVRSSKILQKYPGLNQVVDSTLDRVSKITYQLYGQTKNPVFFELATFLNFNKLFEQFKIFALQIPNPPEEKSSEDKSAKHKIAVDRFIDYMNDFNRYRKVLDGELEKFDSRLIEVTYFDFLQSVYAKICQINIEENFVEEEAREEKEEDRFKHSFVSFKKQLKKDLYGMEKNLETVEATDTELTRVGKKILEDSKDKVTASIEETKKTHTSSESEQKIDLEQKADLKLTPKDDSEDKEEKDKKTSDSTPRFSLGKRDSWT